MHRSLPTGSGCCTVRTRAGRQEVFVQSLPESAGGPTGGGRWPISSNGGRQPAWRADGKEIFYIAADGTMTAVPVQSGPGRFRPGLPEPLFSVETSGSSPVRQYDVSADGRRFLLLQRVQRALSEPLTVILNWQSLLKQ